MNSVCLAGIKLLYTLALSTLEFIGNLYLEYVVYNLPLKEGFDLIQYCEQKAESIFLLGTASCLTITVFEIQ